MRFSSFEKIHEFTDFTSLVLIKYFYDSNNVRKYKFEFESCFCSRNKKTRDYFNEQIGKRQRIEPIKTVKGQFR